MAITIALAGNPNSGKTTLFNELTGSSQYVGNWPGVTVEKKEGKLKGQKEVLIQDLPGVYSLSPYTLEEVVTREYLLKGQPSGILNIVDATNIERNLYLTLQLLETGIPMVIALNMIDLLHKNGDIIDTPQLSALLGCPIVETSALKGFGAKDAVGRTLETIQTSAKEKFFFHPFSSETEVALSSIRDLLPPSIAEEQRRWYSIRLFERDEKAMAEVNLSPDAVGKIEAAILKAEDFFQDDSESIITNERYSLVTDMVSRCVRKKPRTGNLTTSDKIDRIVTHRFWALPIFALVMFCVYYLAVSTIGSMGTDWVNDILFGEMFMGNAGAFLASIGTADWMISLVVDGIIGGVGAVLGFLPQMLVLFFCLSLLEDSGYMARVAFIMDRIFRHFGLSGKSFIPLLVATGCGVPGIMASRTIENDSDRRITIITTAFIPCGAKLPIIALIAGALFPGSVFIAPSAYFIGIGAVLLSGILLKKTTLFSGDPAPFVMELPAYHMPGLKGVLIHMWERARSFVIKAGTVIFLACIILWFLSTFNFGMQMVNAEDSMLAAVGKVLAPLFAPLGWGDWKAAVATISGLLAKENVVGTFGVLYGISEVSENGAEVWSSLQAAFSQLSAFSFLVFNLLCAPCFAAIGATRREMVSAKWTWFAVGYQTIFAYMVSLIIYQAGSRMSPATLVVTGVLLLAVLLVIHRFFGKARRGRPILCEESCCGSCSGCSQKKQ